MNTHDDIGDLITPPDWFRILYDATCYVCTLGANGTNKGYSAKDFMGKAWEALGASTRARIDRVGKSKWQQQLRRALQ